MKYGKSQKEVKDWLLLQRKAVRDNAWASDDSVTVKQFMARYLSDVVKPSVRYSTFIRYQDLINLHICGSLGDLKLAKLTPQIVQKFYTDKLNEGQSSRSVQFMHAILHKALKQAMRWDLVVRNVSDMVNPPSVKRYKPTVWSLEQIKQFIEAAKGHRHYELFVLAVSCGLRQGELLGLQISDVDFTTGFLHIHQSLEIVRGGGTRLTETKTERSHRSIRIPGPVLETLRAYVAGLKRSDGFLFVTTVGTPIRGRDLVKEFKGIIEKAGLPEIRFHDLRHSCATLHLKAGTPMVVVAQILGHSTPALTASVYSHVLPEVEQEASERMAKLLS